MVRSGNVTGKVNLKNNRRINKLEYTFNGLATNQMKWGRVER
jgi:hypothetical protein